jgi:NADH-quinone oxidoreductase subunit H
MKFGWKVLIPVSVGWILVVATLRLLTQEGASQFIIAAFTGGVVLVVLIATSLYESSKKKAEEAARYVPDMPAPKFPVPALPKAKIEEVE